MSLRRARVGVTRGGTRRGFVLAMVLILAAVLSAAVAGSLMYLASEIKTADSRQAQQDALLVAQAGLAEFTRDIGTAARDSMHPATGPILVASDSSVTVVLQLDVSDSRQRQRSTTTRVPDTAEVKAFLIRRAASATDSSLWLVRVRGVAARSRAPTVGKFERTIATYAWYAPGRMNVISAWVSLTGADRTGNSGSYSGVDACGKAFTRFGMVVANDPGAGYSGKLSGMGGLGLDSTRNGATLTSLLDIDWGALSAGSSITPDFVIDIAAGISGLPNAMCARFGADTSYAPTILVKNAGLTEFDYARLCTGGYKNDDKRGLLIVTGDFQMSGSSGGDWSGVLLIGEHFDSNGNQHIEGAVVSGLRVTNDSTYRTAAALSYDNASLSGTKQYTYNSCAVGRALQRYTALRPMRNTYSDQWPSY